MEIIRIFGEILWGVKWSGETKDAFTRTMRLWQDIEYLETFFENNRHDLLHGYHRFESVEDAVWATIEEARQMEKRLLQLCRDLRAGGINSLDSFFVSLHNSEYRETKLSKRKAKGPTRQSWLRIYAIKIDPGCYLIVGSAIKLTRSMNEREHTRLQLQRLEQVRAYLESQGIVDIEGFMELVI